MGWPCRGFDRRRGSGAMWQVIVLAVGFVAAGALSVQAGDPPKGGAKEPEKVEIAWKRSQPVFAIGWETTGTVVETAKKGSYALDLGGNKDLLKQVEALKGKQVVVSATLKVVKGVEIPERKIVTVTEIKEAKPDVKKDNK